MPNRVAGYPSKEWRQSDHPPPGRELAQVAGQVRRQQEGDGFPRGGERVLHARIRGRLGELLRRRGGRPRDRVMELQARWLGLFAEAVAEAVARGELPRDTDIDQLVFEITAMLVRANFS